jgi:MFS family permease
MGYKRPMPSRVSTAGTAKAGAGATSRFAFFYASLILVLSALSTGLTMYAYKYALEGDLNLSPLQLASCNFIINIPLFLSFLFGLLRDRWHPFGIVDRPYLLLAPIVVCVCCVLMGAKPSSLPVLLGALVAANAGAVLSGAVMSAMLALLSKHFGLSGRISAARMILPNLIGALLMSLTGHLIVSIGFSSLSYVSAGISLTVAILAFYRPRELFPDDPVSISGSSSAAGSEHVWPSIRRLLTSRPAMIAVVICFLWDFTPAWGTPLFYQYTKVLHFSPSQYELTGSAGIVGSTVSAILYGFLCFRFSSRKLLTLGTVLCVVVPLAIFLVKSYSSALLISWAIGLTAGIAEAGIYDLLYRASPPGLEGASVSLGVAATYIAGTGGDMVGSLLYEHSQFSVAVILTLATTGLILPLLYTVPRHVFAAREGTPQDA